MVNAENILHVLYCAAKWSEIQKENYDFCDVLRFRMVFKNIEF